jgi:OmpA-OmpF porin, OOP family
MKNVSLFLSLLVSAFTFGQEGINLIENGSFEIIDKVVKKLGSIESATGWTHPTGAKSDLFVVDTKVAEASVSNNPFGMENAQEGDNFAGIIAYSHNDKLPRTYLAAKLSSPLKKDMSYCVVFYVSLGEYSKYASNNIGMNISKREFGTTEKNSIVDETHVLDWENKIFNATFGWDKVCGTYKAKGGEKFITIGNFSTNENTKTEKVKKDPDLKGNQNIAAYYFIDNVSVHLLTEDEKCPCGEVKEFNLGSTVIYSKSDFFKETMTLSEKVEASGVYFGYGKDMVSGAAMRDLNRLVKLMEENPTLKLKIVGHSDKQETAQEQEYPLVFGNISQRRINQVIKFFMDNGIDESRLIPSDMGDRKPSDSSDVSDEELQQAKNRRVEFSVIK